MKFLSTKDCITELDAYYKLITNLKNQRKDIFDSQLSKPQKDEIIDSMEQQMEEYEKSRLKSLDQLIMFPPHHIRHFPILEKFGQLGDYEKSIFIMTKFPEGNTPKDKELTQVIDVVAESIKNCGFIPRIASDKIFHVGLWDNVESYLLGCIKGVAIVESKYKEELNPNVMMEWGWMRGMGKEVLYLVEKDFDLKRADISGLLKDYFTWGMPQLEITNAIQKFLKS